MARASLDKKASDVLVLHVAKLTSVTDYLVLCSGESERQVKAIADNVDAVLSAQRSAPLSIEGTSASNWILMDFGDVVAHVFRKDVREHYALEKLWADAKRVRLPSKGSSGPAPVRQTLRVRPPRVRSTKQA
ncbi:MAG: ribosome silencing factor [Nitrospirota bacterium]